MERSLALFGAGTDNAGLTFADRRKDLYASATAAFRLFGQWGPLRGSFDYALTGVGFVKQNDLSDITHRLQLAATAELVPRQLFIDVAAQAGQQPASLLDRQAAEAARLGDTGRQLRSFSVSPHWRTQWASGTTAELRFTQAHAQTSGTPNFSTDSSRATARLEGGQPNLSWLVDGNWQKSEGVADTSNEVALLELGLGTQWRSRLQTTALLGFERNDFAGSDPRSGRTWGFRARWPLSERTQLDGLYRHRLYGHDHQFSFIHRTGSAIWSLTDSNGVSTSPLKGTAATTLYDVYFAQFQFTETDPVRRDVAVRDYLRTLNLDGTTPVVGGFLGASATQERSQAASVALSAPRSTAALRYFHTRSSLLGTPVPGIVDDFATSRSIRQRGLVADASYRLSPVMALSLQAQYRRAEGNSAAFITTKGVTASWLGQLSRQSDLLAGARYTVNNGGRQPYREAVVFAGYRVRF